MKLKSLALSIGVAVTAAAALSSCKTGNSVMPYFTDLDSATVSNVPLPDFTIKIEPDDELLINVSAANPQAVEPYTIPFQHPRVRDFNTPERQTLESTSTTRRNNSLTQQTYQVDAQGFIKFPVLGKIHVGGMTLNGLASYLTEKIAEKVVDPMVTVELVNFKVNVLGEVSNPGSQLVNRERFSVLDALAGAGDLTGLGERKNVLLIREENGRRVYHRLNLNSKESLESPYFYLRQNDVIYVEPNSVRQANARTDAERQFKLSMTSVIVSAASVIASLAIALFIK